MKVAMFRNASGHGVGLVVDGKIIDYSRAYPAYALATGEEEVVSHCCIIDMLEDGSFSAEQMSATLDFLRDHDLLDAFTVRDAHLMAPIARPPKIVALGRNYAAHARELGHDVPTEPTIFGKASTSVIGPDEDVIYYRFLDRVDHEIELAVVIGRECRRATRGNAMDFVAGYTILNDVTARNVQKAAFEKRNPWYQSKSLDTFGPMGPWIVTPDEIGDPQQLQLTCKVNGEVRQDANTRTMIFPIAELIKYISATITLEPGDVIATGTPEGISAIQPGDVVECIIEKIGTLSNRVVAELEMG